MQNSGNDYNQLIIDTKDYNQNEQLLITEEAVSNSHEHRYENSKDEEQPIMVLAMDIGNNQIEQLKIFNAEQPEKDAYEFCFNHQLDFASMVEIIKQIYLVLNESKKSGEVSSNDIQQQENILTTTLQTEPKAETQMTLGQIILRNQEKKKHLKHQNENLQSYEDIKETHNQNIARELISNEIVITDTNEFYLVNKQKNKEKKDNVNIGTYTKLQPKGKGNYKKDANSANSSNIGVQMYKKCIEERKIINDKVDTLREALNKSEDEIYTFHPKVNKQTSLSKAYRENNKKAYNNPETILQYKEFNQNKYKRLKDQIEEGHPELTCKNFFTPTINRNSIVIDRNGIGKSVSSRFEKLYKDKDITSRRLSGLTMKIKNEYPYRPQLNKPIENIEEIKLKNLDNAQRKREKLLIELETKYQYDKNTNQKLFKPKLLTKPRPKNYNNDIKKKERNTIYSMTEETRNNYSSSKASIEYLNKKKYNSFRKIFQFLDSDEDGIISTYAYSTYKLPNEIINILKPIFNEFKEEYETLNEVEFIRVCDQLYQCGGTEQKKILLTFCDNFNKGKKPSQTLPYSFKPSINKNSSKIDKKITKILG